MTTTTPEDKAVICLLAGIVLSCALTAAVVFLSGVTNPWMTEGIACACLALGVGGGVLAHRRWLRL